MELVFCTGNRHKLDEVSAIMGGHFHFLTLDDIHYHAEIPEPFLTLEENSRAKAQQVATETGRYCFAEDTGLFVAALNGEPGVFSARYSGPDVNSTANIKKLLSNLAGKPDRKAYFKTVVTLVTDQVIQFTGICEGQIALSESGEQGFGYDPVFIPDGDTRCFSAMRPEEKNRLSHRRKAFHLLAQHLDSLKKNAEL